MRAILLTLAVSVGLWTSVPAHAAQAKKSTKTTATSAAKSSPKKASSKKTAVKKTSTKKTSKPAKKTSAAQQQPTPERYAEIQQALVDRGYLETADGHWGQNSTDALKKFQADQNLKSDGKLSALSLTALGLGPRRGAFVVAPEVIMELAATQTEQTASAPTPAD